MLGHLRIIGHYLKRNLTKYPWNNNFKNKSYRIDKKKIEEISSNEKNAFSYNNYKLLKKV